jgi:hypothetical protein
MKKLLALALVMCCVIFVAAIGDVFKAVMVDISGNVVTTPLTFSNQVNMTVAPTNIGNLVRYVDLTNSSASFITSGKVAIANGGTGTNITFLNGSYTNKLQFVTSNLVVIAPIPLISGGLGTNVTALVGSWTNSVNFRANGTNDANAYSVKGVLGFTAIVTNWPLTVTGGIFSNRLYYSNGILTNMTIP